MTLSCGEGNWNRLRAGSAFDFVEPDSLDDALAALAENPVETALLAGGTDLLRNIRLGNRQPSRVISVARLPELIGIEQRDDGGLTIGALTTMAELAANEKVVEHYPALAEAAAQVGSPQVRNRASMGGNLVNASPCADSAQPAYVFDAVVVLKKSKEQRRLALAEFITGPGQTIAEYTADEFGHHRIHQVVLSRKWYAENMRNYVDAFEDATIDLPRDKNLADDHRAVLDRRA